MNIRHLIPRCNGASERGLTSRTDDPFYAFERNLNQLFRDFAGSFDLEPLGSVSKALAAFSPKLEVAESEKEIKISAELPGMEEKDIEVLLEEDVLTIRGEKKEEKEEKQPNFYRSERSYGSFQRSVQLPSDVDAEKVKAEFKKGVLRVSVPKLPEAQVARKKIEIKGE